MAKLKILCTNDLDDPNQLKDAVAKIDPDIEVVRARDGDTILQDVIDEHIATTDIVFAGKFDAKMLAKAKQMKFLFCSSAGVNRFMFPEFVESDVQLCNAKGVHPIQITEHVVCAILCFQREFLRHIKNQIKKTWEGTWSDELCGKTIGVVGVGAIGKRIATVSKALGCNTIGVKRTVVGDIPDVDELYDLSGLDILLEKSDYVVLCLPSTSETKHMFSTQQFEKMKKTGVIVNIGRGNSIDDDALVAALRSKSIAGAALDVFNEEPLSPSSPYYDLDNVLITPHCAGASEQYDTRSIELFCKNLQNFLDGKKLYTFVDKKQGY